MLKTEMRSAGLDVHQHLGRVRSWEGNGPPDKKGSKRMDAEEELRVLRARNGLLAYAVDKELLTKKV